MQSSRFKRKQLDTIQNSPDVRRKFVNSVLNTNSIDEKLMLTRSALLSTKPKNLYKTFYPSDLEKSQFSLSRALSVEIPVQKQTESVGAVSRFIQEDQKLSVSQLKTTELIQCQCQTEIVIQDLSQLEQNKQNQKYCYPHVTRSISILQKTGCRQSFCMTEENESVTDPLSLSNSREDFKKFSQTSETCYSFNNSNGLQNSCFFKKKESITDNTDPEKISLMEEIEKMREHIAKLEQENMKLRERGTFYKGKFKQMQIEFTMFQELYQTACK